MLLLSDLLFLTNDRRRKAGELWVPKYYHYDALGSTDALTDTAEVIDDTYVYKAFGELKASSGTTENPYQWVGEVGYYFDEESTLYSVRRNVYRPSTGSWISPDPQPREGRSVYEYVGNNPVNQIDPSGLKPAFDPLEPLDVNITNNDVPISVIVSWKSRRSFEISNIGLISLLKNPA